MTALLIQMPPQETQLVKTYLKEHNLTLSEYVRQSILEDIDPLDYISPEEEAELLRRMADPTPSIPVDELFGSDWREKLDYGYDEDDGWE